MQTTAHWQAYQWADCIHFTQELTTQICFLISVYLVQDGFADDG